MRQPLIAGNWKMHGSASFVAELLTMLRAELPQPLAARVAVCPPYPYLAQAATLLTDSPIKLGGQDLALHDGGAYTGDVAGEMLADLACEYVIVGHSERREYHHESDAIVAAKFVRAQVAGLTPILCLGETLEERETGITETVIARQLQAVIEQAGIAAFAQAVIAYEPVWAIGTGKTATAEQAQTVHAFIRQQLAQIDATIADQIQLLYGGSMKPNNAPALLAMPDVDGGLIGGAALNAKDFAAICAAC